jgi:hypothetical protein
MMARQVLRAAQGRDKRARFRTDGGAKHRGQVDPGSLNIAVALNDYIIDNAHIRLRKGRMQLQVPYPGDEVHVSLLAKHA